MIKLLKEGNYRLIETGRQIKILYLNGTKNFAWINAPPIGEILVSSYKPHKTDHILSTGKYRLYDVENEQNLTDLLHLELMVGEGVWQGYLLPLGLPNGIRKRRIIPTSEVITKALFTTVQPQV